MALRETTHKLHAQRNVCSSSRRVCRITVCDMTVDPHRRSIILEHKTREQTSTACSRGGVGPQAIAILAAHATI